MYDIALYHAIALYHLLLCVDILHDNTEQGLSRIYLFIDTTKMHKLHFLVLFRFCAIVDCYEEE